MHCDVRLDRESIDRIITWIDLNAPYYGTYESAFPDNLFARSPLNDVQLARLAELTGVGVNAPNVGAEQGGSQVNFTRPEWSPCLAKLDDAGPAYQEALAIIRGGQQTLAATPRADMPGFQLVSDQDRRRQERCDALAQAELASRKAILCGGKFIDKPPPPPETRLFSPIAVTSASGQAFPQGAKSGGEPNPQYAADQAIDGDQETFCCLLDDTIDGNRPTTIPANAAEPVTGHIVFDLGRALPLRGARLIARNANGVFNPRQVDFLALDGPDLGEHLAKAKSLASHSYSPLKQGVLEDVYWEETATRYVALRGQEQLRVGRAGPLQLPDRRTAVPRQPHSRYTRGTTCRLG